MEAPASSADQNLAEMAQRLEAALRRPGGEHANPSAKRSMTIDPADRVGAPPAAPETPRGAEPAPHSEPTSAAPDATAPTPQTASPKTNFDNLEDEMANLLGRPKTPS